MANHEFWKRNLSKKVQTEILSIAAHLSVDARAVQILYNTYFDQDDDNLPWVEKRDLEHADFEFAKGSGLMFDPICLDHDALLTWVLQARDAVTQLNVSHAFIESLESARQDTRSALGSYAHVRHLKRHAFEKLPDRDMCAVCGLRTTNQVDLSARNLRRLKWAGNVEQGNLEYIGLDLHEFAKLEAPSVSDKGIQIMHRLLDAIRNLSDSATLSDLNKGLVGAFKSNKQERQVTLEILGYTGILSPSGWPSYFDGWVKLSQRLEPTHFFQKEWKFPTSGWSGKDGVNERAVQFWFPQLA